MAHRCASRVALLLSAVALACVLGCGSTATSATSFPNISGNWEIVGTTKSPPGLASPISGFFGALQSSNGAVTGTLYAVSADPSAPCVSFTEDLPVTGTIDAANNLSLNTTIAGGTATIQVTLTQDLQTFNTGGTYAITGGACAMPSTPMNAIQIPPITGTYTGTLTLSQSSPAVTANVTAQLVQSTTPTADGHFPLSGTITISGGCPSSIPVSDEYVVGPSIQGAGDPNLLGAILPPVPPATSYSILATVGAFSSACSPNFSIWSGTLTPQ
jgi:hypothetical protein